MSTELDERTDVDEETQAGGGRVAHIVNRDASTEAYLMGTPLEALCGHVWVPSRDPKNYPLCSKCKQRAEELGYEIPTG